MVLELVGGVKFSEKILIFDYSAIAYQAFYGSVSNPQARFLDIVIGCIESVVDIGDKYSLVFAIDNVPFRKLKLYPAYKLNRKKTEVDPKKELISCMKFIKCSKVSSYGEEADDVIATICKQVKDKEKIIITTDSDLITLVDSKTKLFNPRTREATTPLSLLNNKKSFGLINSAIKIFGGDRSDNIKPLRRGFGPGKIKKIISSCESLPSKSIDSMYAYLKNEGIFDGSDDNLFLTNKELVLLKNDLSLITEKINPKSQMKDFLLTRSENYLKYKLIGVA